MVEYYECDCGCTILRVEYEDGEFYFSTYRGKGDKLPWIYRIRTILRIIKCGEPYGDEVILNKETVKKMISYIKEKIK